MSETRPESAGKPTPGATMDALFAEWDAERVVPTVVVAQVVRSGGRQANLRRLLADSYLRLNHCPVITSDPEDLGKLDPTLPLIVV